MFFLILLVLGSNFAGIKIFEMAKNLREEMGLGDKMNKTIKNDQTVLERLIDGES